MSSANPHGMIVSRQAFRACQYFRSASESGQAFPRNLLHVEAFYKIAGGKAASPAGPTGRRQHVIAAGDVVAQRLGAPGPQENRAGRGNSPKQGGFTRGQAQVLRREAVDE